jgi:mannan endo-1,4-beta-mannosidase
MTARPHQPRPADLGREAPEPWSSQRRINPPVGVPGRRRSGRLILVISLVALLAAAGSGLAWRAIRGSGPLRTAGALPTAPDSYLGVYVDGVPNSYSGVTSFTGTTGVRPNVLSYYSGWSEPFWRSFAAMAKRHGAATLVQLDPTGVNVAAIASGRYDRYLTAYAQAVKAFGGPVILSFGHEMNGHWYSWAYRHTPAATFVASWRHIVAVFRTAGARNVTWMWTVNAVKPGHGIPSPAAWWPGKAFVTWVGIDGYYHVTSAQFSSVFGPTIAAVREFTQEPILISETGASQAVGQSAKIADLFSGVRTYGLLGFLWFDVVANSDYRIDSRTSIAALQRGARTLSRRVS